MLNHGEPSASQMKNGFEGSVRPNGINGDEAELHDGSASMETGIELNGDTDIICDEDRTKNQAATNEVDHEENVYPLMP